FRQDLDAAGNIEAPGFRKLKRQWEAFERQHGERQTDHQRQRRPQHRRLLAGLLLPLACPEIKNGRNNNTESDCDLDRAKSAVENRFRQKQTAIVEYRPTPEMDAVAYRRQRLENGVVPEQQLQQQRQVADGFDIT